MGLGDRGKHSCYLIRSASRSSALAKAQEKCKSKGSAFQPRTKLKVHIYISSTSRPNSQVDFVSGPIMVYKASKQDCEKLPVYSKSSRQLNTSRIVLISFSCTPTTTLKMSSSHKPSKMGVFFLLGSKYTMISWSPSIDISRAQLMDTEDDYLPALQQYVRFTRHR